MGGTPAMKRQLGGVLRLTRFQEYTSFVTVTTLLGAAVAHGSFGWPLIRVLAANWLAVGFAFMINDVEDAPDDALSPAKAGRNPVSAGDLSVAPGPSRFHPRSRFCSRPVCTAGVMAIRHWGDLPGNWLSLLVAARPAQNGSGGRSGFARAHVGGLAVSRGVLRLRP